MTADERYGLINRADRDGFGQPPEWLLGRTLREVIGEAAYAVLSPYVRRALAGEHLSFEQHGVPYRLGGGLAVEPRPADGPVRVATRAEGADEASWRVHHERGPQRPFQSDRA